MYKLPKKFREKWIKALRSGNYKQGTGQLKTIDNKYCCLGVALDITGYKFQDMRGEDGLPIDAYVQPRIPKCLWGDVIDDLGYDLAELNDSGATFDEIANAIEENTTAV